MWIGTENGLNRYDGHSLKIFRPGDSNSLSNEIINTIAEDTNGTIWVGTMDGLNYYEPSMQSWHCLRPASDENRKNDLPNNIVWDIQIDDEGLVWIASDVFEFSSYNPSTGKFSYYDWPSFAATLAPPQNPRYRSIHKILPKSRHEFWLATTIGLVSVDTRTKEFRFRGGGYSGSIIDMCYDSINGKIFISVTNEKLFVYDENDESFSELRPQNEPYPSTTFPYPGHGYGESWLGAEQGLLKISSDCKNISLAAHLPEISGSLLPGGVRSVFRDNTNIRWVGTANGVAIYDLAGSSSFFLPLLPISDMAGSNNVGGAYFDKYNNSYFVCSRDPAIVFVINASSGEIRSIKKDASGRIFSACNAIKSDNNGNIWLLTDDHVYRYDRSGEFIQFSMPNQGSNVGFRAFVQDADGNYWFGSFREGLYYYHVKTKKFVPLPHSLLSDAKKIYCLTSDTIRRWIWISVFGNHVYKYDLQTGELTCLEETSGFLQMDLTHDILTDRKGNTWIATDAGGLFKYHPDRTMSKAIERFGITSGLPTNNFISLCEDKSSNIWLLSGNGISVIDSSGKLLHQVNKKQSLVFSAYSSDTRTAHNIFFNETRNELITAVGGGLLFHSPSRKKSITRFPVVITDIRIGTENLSEKERTTHEAHRLPFRVNSVAFEFAGLYYGTPTDIVYEYKLEGYDDNWIRAEKNYLANYQNLPPGKYSFHVRAKNPNGVLAGEVAGYYLIITPPFWQTWWFTAFLTVALSSIVLWLIYTLIQKLKTEKILNSFATSLFGHNTIEDILWDTAKNCVEKLGFTDCVLYEYEADKKLLVQKAAYGPKNPWQREIYNAITIPLGQGIVGCVAKSGKAEIVRNTAKDPRYIVDDEKRYSEITVPIFIDGKVFGIIDSEHAKRNFYRRYHLRILKKMAAICAERISKYLTEEKLRGKIARDLHDEMGSTLTSIQIMCKVAMEGGVKGNEVNHYLQKIKENSSRTLESIGDMVWVINPANDNFEKLMFRMKEFGAEILEPARINYQFMQEGDLHMVQLNIEQRKEIYMIFKEAITNAAKYSGTSNLHIHLVEKNGILKMEITDHGVGFNTTDIVSGNGVRNMKERAGQIGAELTIDTMPGNGCSVIFQLNLT
jgi:signal transduction histidine kinase/ligand-binding sensor domain-containing protein